MSMNQPSRITKLAEIISDSVTKIDRSLVGHGIPSPSFEEDAPIRMPEAVREPIAAVLDATTELYELLQEPISLIKMHGGHNNSVCLQAMSRFGIPSMVPLGGQTSFADIAWQTGLTEHFVRRLLRHAITMRLFQELEPGVVAHTKASKLLVDPLMNDWLRVGTEEMWPAAVRMVDACLKWPGSCEPNQTGFSLANGEVGSIYTLLDRSPERAARFANAMNVFAALPQYAPSHLTQNYDWASLGAQIDVLDVGGAKGHVAVALARQFDNLTITVQDMDKVITGAEAEVPEGLRGRVRFSSHDLLSPQPENITVDVVLLRWVLHNWSDPYAIRILREQISSLKPGARIIIQDVILPEPGAVATWREREMRSYDLDMAATFNSHERTMSEWRSLLARSDPRFVVARVIEPQDSALGIIEVIWHATI